MVRLPIRQEEPPDDAIVVVRAGVMAPDRIAATASDAFEDFGMYAVSVEVAINKSVAELCRTSPRIVGATAKCGSRRLADYALRDSPYCQRSSTRTSTSCSRMCRM
jgi:hypothetical protein